MPEENQALEFKPGFPEIFKNEQGQAIVFEVKLRNGELRKAIIDWSKEYYNTGLQWHILHIDTNIPSDRVLGWRKLTGTVSQ